MTKGHQKNHQEKTLARKFAFKFLYQKTSEELSSKINPSILEDEMNEFEESYTAPDDEHSDNDLGHETRFFGRRLVLDTFASYEQTMSYLNPCLEPRTLDKLDRLERTIVLLGATEMSTRKDTPTPVVINEYVEMAKQYGNQKSYTFVNGVLDKLAKATR